MPQKKKVLFAVSECQKFAVTGGLAEVSLILPKEIMKAKKTYSVSVIMPLYKKIREKYEKSLTFLGKTEVTLAWRKLYCGVFKLKFEGVDYYFIDNKYYFERDNLYGHYDDGERFAFFSKSIFDVFEIIGFVPNIIHAHDWHTALVPIYLDILFKKEGKYLDIKSVFTIHNIEYQGVFGKEFLEDVLGIDKRYDEILDYNGCVNLMKGAIVCADKITTVSSRYAREISTAQYACGLEHIIRQNINKISGIVNGINEELYNPRCDETLKKTYDVDTFDNKLENKEALQRALNLEINHYIPVICMITRLATHKGIDLVIDKFDEIMALDVEFVMLGTGESFYQEKFREFQRKYPNRVSSLITFDLNLSKKLYGGSDLFLMPSKMEPCGLSQMIASRYGTVPIVRATGGLYDTIKDYEDGNGNGFVFKEYNSYSMLDKIKEAVNIYRDREKYENLAKKAMQIDFSFSSSAKSYVMLYDEILKKVKVQ